MAKYVFVALVFFGITGCNEKTEPKPAPQETIVVEPPQKLTGPLAHILEPADTLLLSDFVNQKLEFAETKAEIKIEGITIKHYTELANSYAANQFKALWVTSAVADSVVNAIIAASADGLNPADYHIKKIEELLEKAKQEQEKDLSAIAELDILMTEALLEFGEDLLVGKVDPTTQNHFYNFKARELTQPVQELLVACSKNEDLQSFFKAVRPQSLYYENMQASLKKYQALADAGGWAKINWPAKLKLEPNDTNINVLQLRDRLRAEGFLDSTKSANDTVYDPQVQAAMLAFQFAHGLNTDTVVGPATIKLLNISAQQKVDAIICNLERLRWGVGNLQGTYILVNAAEYRLYYFVADSLEFSTEVIIGKQHHETPFFTADLSSIVINPTWTVPYSIATKEMLPKLKKNPSYLASQNMVLLNHSGEVIDAASINFSQYTSRNFPFIIRQEPGDNNALGHVKFNMPNPYSIYLHDTPSRSLFSKDERAFSHGCIRVNKPLELAKRILEKQESWTLDSINSIVKTHLLTTVKLEQPIPVLLTYITTYTDAQQHTFFFADVYNRDNLLLQELRN